MRALERSELVFGIGPAGTGKTYLAVAHAAMLLERGAVERIVLSRPAVEAGERLGFLPGDMKEKVDPYLRPLYDALYDMMPRRQGGACDRRRASSRSRRWPSCAAARLRNAAIILDEAQNTTPMQMKMFLTRLGEGGAHDRHRRSDARSTCRATPSRGWSRRCACSTASRASSPCASTMSTWCATRWWPRSCAPMTATPDRAAAATGSDAGSRMDRRRHHSIEAGTWPPARRSVWPRLAGAGAVAAAVANSAIAEAADPNCRCSSPTTPHIRTLNAQWRGKDKPTNVLSFPAFDIDARRSAAARCSATSCSPTRRLRARPELEDKLRSPSDPSGGAWLSSSSRLRSRERRGGRRDGGAAKPRFSPGLPSPTLTSNWEVQQNLETMNDADTATRRRHTKRQGAEQSPRPVERRAKYRHRLSRLRQSGFLVERLSALFSAAQRVEHPRGSRGRAVGPRRDRTAFSPGERAMLNNILRLREMRVEDVMVPRADIKAVEISTTLGDLLRVFEESGHSRMPVYQRHARRSARHGPHPRRDGLPDHARHARSRGSEAARKRTPRSPLPSRAAGARSTFRVSI